MTFLITVRSFAPSITAASISASGIWSVNCFTRNSPTGIAASGTVTVEAAMLGLPLVVSYKVSWLTYQVAKALVKLPSITIANLVTGQTVYEERLQYDAVPDKLASALEDILPGGSRRQTCLEGIEKCVKMLGEDTKASARAAEAVIELLEGRAGDL